MPEAVIVAAARSPIGRAFKGSLASDPTRRPDRRSWCGPRWPRCPQLDPADIDDLMLGCGLPGGEQGFNMARVVAVLLGYDRLPGTTVTRYCSSSLQTTRMAMHAIRAGEGDVFISAGRGDGVPVRQGQLRLAARHPQPGLRRRRGPHRAHRRAGRGGLERSARGRAPARRLHRDGADRGEPGPAQGRTREDMDHFGVRSQNLAEKAIADGFFAREITPVTLPDGTVVSTDDGPRAGGRPTRRSASSSRCSVRTGG